MKCKDCGTKLQKVSSNFDHEYSTMQKKIYDFFECESCGYIVINQMELNHLSEIYPSNYYSYSPEGHNWLYDVKFRIDQFKYRKILKRFEGRDLKAIDIGGGTGQQLSTLLKAYNGVFTKSIVVDLDPNSKKFANSNGHEFVNSRFEEYKSTEKSDVILALNILEHVENPSDFLGGIRSNLSHDGIAILQTPNYKAIDYRIFRRTYWGGFHTPRHFYIYNDKSLKNLVISAGLKVESQEFIPAGPFWAFSLISLGRRRFNSTSIAPLYLSYFFAPLVICFSAFDFFRAYFKAKTSQQWLIISLKK